jgi:hypothetical protein
MGTPPVPHRRRTSSGSSGSACGTSPPTTNWTVSPPPWSLSPRSSPLRHSRSSGRFTPPSLPPILGSPNTWSGGGVQPMVAAGMDNNNGLLLRRANSTEMTIRPSASATRNTVVLNYSPSQAKNMSIIYRKQYKNLCVFNLEVPS